MGCVATVAGVVTVVALASIVHGDVVVDAGVVFNAIAVVVVVCCCHFCF